MITLQEGALLGRYRLVRTLGRGGMGEVWEARDEHLDRAVALKALPPSLVAEEAARRRFHREALALARLVHPNVVTIFDVGEGDGDVPYLVMELVRGRPLTGQLGKGPLPLERVLPVAEQVARALAAAHAAGIVHRDLKPSNVMITDEGQVKVLDFGLAKAVPGGGLEGADSITSSGAVMGSYPYMSPEQARGAPVGPAGDVFSCGVLLYEMVTGTRPFDGASPVAVLQAIVDGHHLALDDARPGIDPSLAAIVERCLAREAGDRYPDAAALAADLRALRDTTTTQPAAPTVALPRAGVVAVRLRRRQRLTRAAGLAVAAAVLGSAAGIVLGRRGMEPVRPDPGAWRSQALLQTAGLLRHPRFHPDGSSVVVERTSGDEGEILLVPIDGGEPQVLARARPGEFLARPGISPDGRLLAYAALGGGQRVEVVPATGGPPVAVVPGADRPTWLGGRRLLFSRFTGGTSGLWTLDLDSRQEAVFLDQPGRASWWQAEPRRQGGFAVLGGPDDVHGRIYSLERPGAAPVPWTDELEVNGFSWSRDGGSLVAVVGESLVRVTDRGVARLMAATPGLRDPTFSPDGGALVVVRNQTQTDLVAVDPANGSAGCLLCGVLGAGWGSVAGDGAIVYRRLLGPVRAVFVRGPGGEEHRLTPAGENSSCPVASPDGTRVAYLARDEKGKDQLRVVARSGGQGVVLAEDVVASEFPSWSPDGTSLAYAAGDPPRVFVVSGGGGSPRLLTPAGGDYPSWSPDGAQIAYVVWTDAADPNQGAWVVPSQGGAPVRVSDVPMALAWGRDGRTLHQVRREGGRLVLWSADRRSWNWRRGPVVKLGAPPAPHAEHLPITLDPVSGKLVMSRRVTTGELELFEGVQPERW